MRKEPWHELEALKEKDGMKKIKLASAGSAARLAVRVDREREDARSSGIAWKLRKALTWCRCACTERRLMQQKAPPRMRRVLAPVPGSGAPQARCSGSGLQTGHFSDLSHDGVIHRASRHGRCTGLSSRHLIRQTIATPHRRLQPACIPAWRPKPTVFRHVRCAFPAPRSGIRAYTRPGKLSFYTACAFPDHS